MISTSNHKIVWERSLRRAILVLMIFSLCTVYFSFRTKPVKAVDKIYIRTDGSIDPSTAPIWTIDNITYQLTDNIVNRTIVVERDNIIFDGTDFTIQGADWITGGNGITLSSRFNVTVMNTNVKSFNNAIYVRQSVNCSIFNNTLTGNWNSIKLDESSAYNQVLENNATGGRYGYGVRLYGSSNYNIILRNTLKGHSEAISVVDSSSNNIIAENHVEDNTLAGIYLGGSDDNIVSSNQVVRNDYGIRLSGAEHNLLFDNIINVSMRKFSVEGRTIQHFENDINVSNRVDGNPIYYWTNKDNLTIPSNAGYVALINCTRMKVENLTLTNNGQGILLAYTTESIVAKNNLTDNAEGIRIYKSSNITISENFTSNGWMGISGSASNTTISRNTITDYTFGMYLSDNTINNLVSENCVLNNSVAVKLQDLPRLSNNTFFHNNFINNTHQIVEVNWLKESMNMWDAGYPSGGNYWSDHDTADLNNGLYQNVTGSDGIGDIQYIINENNIDRYPIMKPYPWESPDLGITGIVPCKTVLTKGFNLTINVMIFNYGDQQEESHIVLNINETETMEYANISVRSIDYAIINFTWNTASCEYGRYTLTAEVAQLPGEMDISDNLFTDSEIFVTILGDVDADFDVDIFDIVAIAGAYGSIVGEPEYDANYDLMFDGQIDIFDIILTANHYGEEYTP